MSREAVTFAMGSVVTFVHEHAYLPAELGQCGNESGLNWIGE